MTNPVRSPALLAPTAAPAPEPAMDTLFGRFWPDAGVPGSVRAVLYSLGVGLLAGIVLPFRDLGLGTFVVLLVAGGVTLSFSVHRRSPFTLACAALCVLLAATVVVRDADWIVVLCLLAGGAVCVAGLVNGRTLPAFVLAGVAWPLAGLRGLPWLARSARAVTGLGSSAAALRTAVWSLLGVVVFGLLFASADAVFAEWAGAVVPDLRLGSFVLRAFLTVAVGGVVLAATYLALNPPVVEPAAGAPRPVAHRYEWLAPVLLVDGVFLVFLAAQATVIFGGHDYLERTTGLTYAEYVHQGFGQLTVATALTLLVVWAAARKAPRTTAVDRVWLRGSLGLLCVLTLVVVASALHRMHVYQEAYGFTRLRLLVDVFEGWLGLLVLGVIAAGLTLRAAWLPRAALLSGAGLLLVLAAVNPDAWIARAQPGPVRRDREGRLVLPAGALRGRGARARHPAGRGGRVCADGARAGRRRLAGVEPRAAARRTPAGSFDAGRRTSVPGLTTGSHSRVPHLRPKKISRNKCFGVAWLGKGSAGEDGG